MDFVMEMRELLIGNKNVDFLTGAYQIAKHLFLYFDTYVVVVHLHQILQKLSVLQS